MSLLPLAAGGKEGEMAKEKIPDQKLKALCNEIRDRIDRWNLLKTQGGSDPFWEDGMNMNLVRNQVVFCREEVKKICDRNDIPLPEEYWVSVPPKVPDYYMAKPKEIEKNARRALERYEADKNYQWLKTCNISTNTKKAVGYQNVMSVVDHLKEAIKKNDLVAMRRYSDSRYDLERFVLCRRKIEEALAEEDEGQMELFDFI